MLRNQPAPDPARILSADELFSDGVLLPLDLLFVSRARQSVDPPDSDGTAPPISGQNDTPSGVPEPGTRAASLLVPKAEPVAGSKRWMDSFKKSEKTSPPNDQVEYVATLGQYSLIMELKFLIKKFDCTFLNIILNLNYINKNI